MQNGNLDESFLFDLGLKADSVKSMTSIRPLLSLKWLFFDETAGRVRYQHSRHGSEEGSMDYLGFIAIVTIPIMDFVVLGVLFIFSDTRRWKSRKMGRDGEPVQKGNTHNFKKVSKQCYKKDGL